ncbi:hypothetical protein SAMN04489729_6939 [Amycolatopsis lurida]|nr:hypothetical protein SAMN04489729_6939 [Amycolatopsis lurida]
MTFNGTIIETGSESYRAQSTQARLQEQQLAAGENDGLIGALNRP